MRPRRRTPPPAIEAERSAARSLAERDELVILGRISGVYGVWGWVRLHSWTRPLDNIIAHNEWFVGSAGGWQRRRVRDARRQGKTLVAALEGVTDRVAAHGLIGAQLAVARAALPPVGADEFYWVDLQGLQVINGAGVELGAVSHLIETGGNDVLVIEGDRQRLVPFVFGEYVLEVDLEAGVIRVDWDPDF